MCLSEEADPFAGAAANYYDRGGDVGPAPASNRIQRQTDQGGCGEVGLGLIPGAGGTVSVTRRIGRHRTAYLALSGETIDASTALSWGLVDGIAAADVP